MLLVFVYLRQLWIKTFGHVLNASVFFLPRSSSLAHLHEHPKAAKFHRNDHWWLRRRYQRKDPWTKLPEDWNLAPNRCIPWWQWRSKMLMYWCWRDIHGIKLADHKWSHGQKSYCGHGDIPGSGMKSGRRNGNATTNIDKHPPLVPPFFLRALKYFGKPTFLTRNEGTWGWFPGPHLPQHHLHQNQVSITGAWDRWFHFPPPIENIWW